MPGMRVLIAPGAHTVAHASALTAGQAAAAMAQGWAHQAPRDTLDVVALSDGGAGFVDVIAASCGGALSSVTARGPAGAEVRASFVLVADTAYVESAQVVGAHLDPRRDPTRTTSAGLATVLQAAVDAGARRVVVGCGPAAAHDGGAGLLAALGAGDHPALCSGALALADLPDDALSRLADVRARWAGIELVAATDDDLPLLGFHGVSATYAQARGASAEQAQAMESALGRFADVAQRSRSLLGRGQAAAAGSGAAGGVGFALLLLGARQVSGARAVLDAVGVAQRLDRADLVVTGAGVVDAAALRHGVIAAVSQTALERGVASIVIAGRVEVGRREMLAIGVSATYSVADRGGLADANPAGLLARRTQRVARTWSR